MGNELRCGAKPEQITDEGNDSVVVRGSTFASLTIAQDRVTPKRATSIPPVTTTTTRNHREIAIDEECR